MNRFSRRRLAAVTAIVSLALLGVSGCATTSLLTWNKDKIPEASRENPVIKILPLWEAGEGPGLDHKTCRGFVGRLMFFTSKDKFPVKINGALYFYVFDDEGPREQQIKPIEIRQTPEVVAAEYSVTDLGATYGVFIPYSKPGHHRMRCSIRVRYVPIDEHTKKENHLAAIMSESAHVTLPGPLSEESAKADAEAKEQARAKMQADATVKAPERKLVATSINKSDGQVEQASGVSKASRKAHAPLTEAERLRIIAEARGEPSPLPHLQESDGGASPEYESQPGRTEEVEPAPLERRPARRRHALEEVEETGDDAEEPRSGRSLRMDPAPPADLRESERRYQEDGGDSESSRDGRLEPEHEFPPRERRHPLSGLSEPSEDRPMAEEAETPQPYVRTVASEEDPDLSRRAPRSMKHVLERVQDEDLPAPAIITEAPKPSGDWEAAALTNAPAASSAVANNPAVSNTASPQPAPTLAQDFEPAYPTFLEPQPSPFEPREEQVRIPAPMTSASEEFLPSPDRIDANPSPTEPVAAEPAASEQVAAATTPVTTEATQSQSAATASPTSEGLVSWLANNLFTMQTMMIVTCLFVMSKVFSQTITISRRLVSTWRKLALLLKEDAKSSS